MSCQSVDLTIKQGKSYARVLRWASQTKTYKAIQSASRAAPCSLGVTAHGLTAGWIFEVVGALGMTELNRDPDNADRLANDKDWYEATVTDANTLSLNDVVSNDFGTYTANSGSIAYFTPYDLDSFTARMSIKDAVGDATSLVSLTTANGGIVIDNTLKTITIVITAAATALFDWTTGVYDLELISPAGTVTELCKGNVTVIPEVTT